MTTAPAAATAQSPARRSTFTYALPAPGRIGMRISVRISAGPTTVSYGPVCELAHRHHPLAAGAAARRTRPGGAPGGREVLGRVGLAQRPADRAAVAHHRVGDHPLGVVQDPVVLADDRGREQLGVAHHRADAQHVAVDPDASEVA